MNTTYPETMDYNSAYRLANKITAYWSRRPGKMPDVRVEAVYSSADRKDVYYVVRSNMKGGLPQ